MTRAVLSIGSNLGDRLAHLQAAVDVLAPWLVVASSVVRTPPWGPVPQDDFLNAVLLVDDPAAGPDDWLARAQVAEWHEARTRPVRWGPRTLDVDVVTVTDAGREVRRGDPGLTLPHPRAAERAFVLVPWSDVEPDARLAGTPVTDLLADLGVADGAGLAAAGIVRLPELVLQP